METIYNGSCLCGKVSFQVKGKPLLSAYCHCTVCQRAGACVFIHTLHYAEGAFSWTSPDPDVPKHVYPVWPDSPKKQVYHCTGCGARVAGHNGDEGKWTVRGSQFARDENGKINGWEEVKPTAHIFYDTRMLDLEDDIPKWDGFEGHSNRIG